MLWDFVKPMITAMSTIIELENRGSIKKFLYKRLHLADTTSNPRCKRPSNVPVVPFYDYYERTMHNLEKFAREPVIDERMKTPVDETYKE